MKKVEYKEQIIFCLMSFPIFPISRESKNQFFRFTESVVGNFCRQTTVTGEKPAYNKVNLHPQSKMPCAEITRKEVFMASTRVNFVILHDGRLLSSQFVARARCGIAEVVRRKLDTSPDALGSLLFQLTDLS